MPVIMKDMNQLWSLMRLQCRMNAEAGASLVSTFTNLGIGKEKIGTLSTKPLLGKAEGGRRKRIGKKEERSFAPINIYFLES